MSMKSLLAQMQELENKGSTTLTECMDPSMGQAAAQGQPVSVNVSMNASGKENVSDLIDLMKNAGLGGAEEVSTATLSPRMDMEKFRSVVDNSNEDINEGADFADLEDKISARVEELSDDGMEPEDAQDQAAEEFGVDPDDYDAWKQAKYESYANEPDEAYGDVSDVTASGDDLHKSKGAYAKAQDGDNAMAVSEDELAEVEALKQQLMAELSKYKETSVDEEEISEIDGNQYAHDQYHNDLEQSERAYEEELESLTRDTQDERQRYGKIVTYLRSAAGKLGIENSSYDIEDYGDVIESSRLSEEQRAKLSEILDEGNDIRDEIYDVFRSSEFEFDSSEIDDLVIEYIK